MIVYVSFYFDVFESEDNEESIGTAKLGGYWDTEKMELEDLRNGYKEQALSNMPDGIILKDSSHESIIEHDKD